MAKAETSTFTRSGTMAVQMTEEEFNALPDELKEQISTSPAPKDSIAYYLEKMISQLRNEKDEEKRRFNVKDVLMWCYTASDGKVFKIQSVRTVLKKQIKAGLVQEVAGTPGRDKVYEAVV